MLQHVTRVERQRERQQEMDRRDQQEEHRQPQRPVAGQEPMRLQPGVQGPGQQKRRHRQVGHVNGPIGQPAGQVQPAIALRFGPFRIGHLGRGTVRLGNPVGRWFFGA